MEPFDFSTLAGVAAGGLGLVLIGSRAAWRRRLASGAASDALAPEASAPAVPPAVPPDGLLHRVELRVEAVEALQAALAARLDALGSDDAAERRLQAMAGQILGLVRDKAASLEVALGGLDALRARMRVLETIGDPAEARALFERLGVRLEAVETAQAGAGAAVEARLAGLEAAANPVAEIAERLAQLHAQKDATVEAVFARLAPLEAQLAGLEGALASRDPAMALERVGERLEATRAAQASALAALGARLAGLEGAETPVAELAERLAQLHAQKAATVETVLARLAPLEAKLAALEGDLASRDPAAALFALGARLDGLEGAETPFADLSERLAQLSAQKDAAAAVFARLAPLEARLAGLERAEAADAGAAAARAEAQAIAAQLIAARTVAEETRLFASRIGLLEASLPRLSHAQAQMMQALERQAAPAAAGPDARIERPVEPRAGSDVERPVEPAAPAAPDTATDTAEDAVWRLPRVVSVHTG